MDGVYVQPSLAEQLGAHREVRIEEAVAAVAYPVKVAVLRPADLDPDDPEPDADEVLTQLHLAALRDLTVDPAVYVGVDIAAHRLTVRQFDVTAPAGQAIAVAADRAPGDVGRQLVITTTLLADSRAEQAYDRLLDETTAPVASARPPAGGAEQPEPGAVDLPAVLISVAVLVAALLSALWTRGRTAG